jgi:hypothetical protein
MDAFASMFFREHLPLEFITAFNRTIIIGVFTHTEPLFYEKKI